jgi:hypothetical protein
MRREGLHSVVTIVMTAPSWLRPAVVLALLLGVDGRIVDRGCGARAGSGHLGADVTTDVTVKQ